MDKGEEGCPGPTRGYRGREHYCKDHCNDATQTVKKSGDSMKDEKDEFLINVEKSATMTMRRRPLTDRYRLELRQPLLAISDLLHVPIL